MIPENSPAEGNRKRFIAFRVFFNARFYYPVLAVLFLDLGLSAAEYSLLNFVWALVIVCGEVPSGALADRIGRRPLVIAAAVCMVLEMLALLAEARIYRPQLMARFVLNRCAARTVIARETAETLADHDPPLLSATIGQRVAFADLAQSGRLVFEADDNSAAAREIAALTAEVGRLAP